MNLSPTDRTLLSLNKLLINDVLKLTLLTGIVENYYGSRENCQNLQDF